ncbi:YCF48-related protein [Azoarcus sp. KH32C]|uniref:WD40/YVTN/BNR-like repeat-containing protein n=1 Tax=Azoarcus sp. KH32C TaxID=748247 RepID=UPI00034B3014|nr:YCF48-related protein [Azoarcus sp. KH32C]
MKFRERIRTLSSVLLLMTVACPSWAFQDPLDRPATKSALAPRSLLNAVARAGERLVVAGQRGHILYSDDAGKNWTQAEVPVSSDLTAVHFPTSQKGWAVGHDGVVLATTDGGKSWVKQLDGRGLGQIMQDYYARFEGTGIAARQLEELRAAAQRFAEEGADKPFLSVWFDSETDGYAVGVFNLIFHTSDGGKTWTPWFDRTENPEQLHFSSIQRAGEGLYLAGERGMVLKFDKEAQRFRSVSVDYPGSFFGLTGREQSVVVFGLRGNVFRSEDGGAQWHKVTTGLNVTITGATLTEDGRIVLVSQRGDVLMSADNGRSFTPSPMAQALPASAVAPVGTHALVLVGTRGVNIQALKK